MRNALLPLLAAAFLCITGMAHAAASHTGTPAHHVVLLTGTQDAAAWNEVRDALARDGFSVSEVPADGVDLAGEVARVRNVIDAQDGPVVLAGYSHAGAVVAQAGDDSRVRGLVYIAAMVPGIAEAPAADAPADTKSASLPAQETKPSVYLVAAQQDPALPVATQRLIAHRLGAIVVELSGERPIYRTAPATVAKVIEQGAAAGIRRR